MKIAKAEVFTYALPLETPIPLRGATLPTRTGLLLKLYSAEGHTAWGEAAPLPGFSRESLEACERSLVDAAQSLLKLDGHGGDGALGKLPAFQSTTAHSAAYFAVESAWRHLAALGQGKAPWQMGRPDRSEQLLLNALLTGDRPTIRSQAERAAALGYRAVKLKVGREHMADDLQLVRMVREIIGPDIELRLDANQAWNLEDAILFGKAVREWDIAYVEEPCASPFDLPSFHEVTGVPYAVDESIQTLHDLVQQRATRPGIGLFRDLPVVPVVQGAKAIVWKPTLVHTPNLGALLFDETKPGQTRTLVLSGAFESGVGTAALASYAARFADAETPVGLDTYRWLMPDLLQRRLPLDSGVVDLNAIHLASRKVDESQLTPVWPR